MSYKPFLIAPYNTGLERDLEPWLLPEDAFQRLENAFIYRGRVKKRYGYSLLGDTSDTHPQLNSRLRVQIGTTNGGGNLSGNVPGTVYEVGQMFSVGNNLFTVNVTGAPAATLANGTGTATYNTTTGAYAITASSPTTPVFFYPSQPVMGLIKRENSAINVEETLAFDTQFCYQRSGGAWIRVGTGAADTWTGSDSNFFWGVNYQGANSSIANLYVTNFNFNIGASTADNIRYLPSTATAFTTLRPQLNTGATRYLETARVLIPFKDRLVAFNTVESTAGVFSQFSNRCRFSQNGDPTAPATSWLDDTPGRGGFIDAPTKQAIVSAEFIRDKLIVYFESSTWELVYTANQILPFRWQKINTELGAESTFSKVPFDKVVLSVGNRGIHACTGNDIQRIDDKIPDEVFRIHNGNEGPERVHGIRDYYAETVYWTFPTFQNNPTYPNRVFVYNYQSNNWAIFKDTFTCFGYFQIQDDRQWQTLNYPSWEVWNEPWNSPYLQSGHQSVIAGNQQGFTVILDVDDGDNDEFYQITNIAGNVLTVINHNLETGDYVQLKNAGGITENDQISIITRLTDDTLSLDFTPTGTYTGGGTLKVISNIDILTKRYNPYITEGVSFNLPYIDFFVDKTTNGEFSIDMYLNESDYSIRNNRNAIPGNNVLSTAAYPLVRSEAVQNRLWHRYFCYITGFNVQFRYYMNDAQMRDFDISSSNFVINGAILYASPAEQVIT